MQTAPIPANKNNTRVTIEATYNCHRATMDVGFMLLFFRPIGVPYLFNLFSNETVKRELSEWLRIQGAVKTSP